MIRNIFKNRDILRVESLHSYFFCSVLKIDIFTSNHNQNGRKKFVVFKSVNPLSHILKNSHSHIYYIHSTLNLLSLVSLAEISAE